MSVVVPLQTNINFPLLIEQIVQEKKIDYMNAVLFYCEQNSIEIEFAGELIRRNPILRSKIQLEAENLNFLKRQSRLPI